MDNVNIPEVQSPVVETTTEVVKSKPKLGFLKILIPLILLCLIVAGVWGWYRVSSFKPYRVMVSNVSPGSATVSWITEEPTPGMVIYQDKEFKLPFMFDVGELNKAYDDRDYTNAELEEAEKNAEAVLENSGSQVDAEDIFTEIVVTDIGKYYVHHVTVRGLEPSKSYYFMIGDGNVYRRIETENTKEVSFKTAKEIEEVKTPDPAYGVLRYYRGEEEGYERPKDTIVYAVVSEEIQGVESSVISCLTNEEGGWYLDLMNAYMDDGTTFWDNIKGYEATYIVFNLTIENTWDGRWSTEVDVYSRAPAKSIDMRMDDKLDKDLIYEGVSFEEETRVSSALKESLSKVLAAETENNDEKEEPENALCKDKGVKANIEGDYCLNPLPEVSEATGGKNLECIDAIDAVFNNNLKVNYGDNIPLCAAGQCPIAVKGFSVKDGRGTEERLASEDGGSKYVNSVSQVPDFLYCENVLYDGKTVRMFDEDGNLIYNLPTGTCKEDKCGHMGFCGWNNDSLCDCTCEKDGVKRTEDIGAGQMCFCVDGVPKVYADSENKYSALVDAVREYAARRGMCRTPNLPGGGTIAQRACYSYTYACWFPAGYTTLDNSLQCYASGRWGTPGGSEGDYGPKDEMPNLEPQAPPGNLQSTKVNMETDSCFTYLSTMTIISETEDGEKVKCGSSTNYEWESVEGDYDFTPGGKCQSSIEFTSLNNNLDYYCVYKSQEDGKVLYAWEEIGTSTGYFFGNNMATRVDMEGGEVGDNVCKNTKYGICSCYMADVLLYFVADGSKCEKKNQIQDKPIKEESNLRRTLIRNLFAEEDISVETYIVNTSESIVEQLGIGIHLFEVNGDFYIVPIFTDYGDPDIFLDVNNNGVLDAGDINVKKDFETIKVISVERAYRYNLREGFNFISFPFISEDSKLSKASNLVKELNNQTFEGIKSISKLENGRWISVGANAGNFDQNDFRILPGEGYLIEAKYNLIFSLQGKEIKYEQLGDSAPILLIPGWNLMGIYGSKTKTYTAKSMLEDINSYKGITFEAVNVTRWEEEKGAYEGYQIEEEDAFGFDFPIERQRGYFVKVLKGQGNWHPGVR